MNKFSFITLLFSLIVSFTTKISAQSKGVDTNQINGFASKKEFTVADVTVVGSRFLDTAIIKTIFAVKKGSKVMLPNDERIAKGLKAVWNQGLLEDITVNVKKVEGEQVYLELQLKERPRFEYYSILGTSNNEKAEIKEKLDENIGTRRIVSEGMKMEIKNRVKEYFMKKGFTNATVTVTTKKGDRDNNAVGVIIKVVKGKKVRINQINIVGNDYVSDFKLKRKLKDTKEKIRLSRYPAYKTSVYGNEPMTRKEYLDEQGYLHPSKTLEYIDPYFRYKVFTSSKFDKKKYKQDKRSLLNYYNSIGYRDAVIVKDTVYNDDYNPNNINLDLQVKEGRKYYFGDIEWSGNTKYSDSLLAMVLGIKRGDVYNKELLDSKLGSMPNMDGSIDFGTLYLDQGHLFFRAEAVETSIVNDTINHRINIVEGPEATIKHIYIKGNNKTNDYVLRREILSKPGYKFNRSDIISSVRQISQLGYIDQNSINPVPVPNPADNTVDITYNVTEKSSDQMELQAGYGGGIGFTGTAGITLNNFSARNLFKGSEWRPIPMGDGQKLSLRWQSNGLYFNSLNFSFTEPWLGGKKPIGLTFGAVYSRISQGGYARGYSDPNRSYISNYGANITLSKRLKWPDNRFIGAVGLNYQRYFLKDYSIIRGSSFNNGISNNLHLMISLSRNSIDNPVFPRSGSNVSLRMQLTPPYSLFTKKDFTGATEQEKYKWIEYQKYRFDAEWYQKVAGDLILKLSGKFGFLGHYNSTLGNGPFERFQVGGDGMTGFTYFVGKDIIAHRGYDIYKEEATIFNKYTAELRYPFSLNPSSTIYGLAFFETANGWNSLNEYNPFELKRTAGVGIRMMLPMFGLLGFDYGFGFENYTPGAKITQGFKFSFMLGREPD